MEIYCVVEVVSLMGFVHFVKGPEMGTVHDNDHTIVDCPITLYSLFLLLSGVSWIYFARFFVLGSSWSVKFVKLSCTVITLAVVMLCPS
jgi:hypothetical protein